VDIGLGIYYTLEDSVIVLKLEPGVHHLHGPRWLLEWQFLSSRFDEQRSSLAALDLCVEKDFYNR